MLNPMDFVEPQLIRWKSFDGLALSGFMYQPDATKFPGRRPVIVNIHGGPEGQARPGFINRNNYMVNELGIAMIYPNVRGSSGFGKAFSRWITAGSARIPSKTSAHCSTGSASSLIWMRPGPGVRRQLWRLHEPCGLGALPGPYRRRHRRRRYFQFRDVSHQYESYRRDLRRAEYGDERDPVMRSFLEKISPLNNAERIRKPLLIAQGRNDPRVPYTESEQIVAQLKKQKTPLWCTTPASSVSSTARRSVLTRRTETQVIAALCNQKRFPDSLRVVERRYLLKKRAHQPIALIAVFARHKSRR